ncbi:hypothetical protein [Cellvibrio sp. pealriver]|uniref:hypothetical protein n=1 Tax=Cellvibrio sp. pealriver TaxID=1622269 RepID=UPI00066FBB29|nr:hypothetical protein [Cellvibrio sp. pealriver]
MTSKQEKGNLIVITLIAIPFVCIAITWLLSAFPILMRRSGGSITETSVEVYLIVFVVGALVSLYGWHYLVKKFKCSDCGGLFYGGSYLQIRNKSCVFCKK